MAKRNPLPFTQLTQSIFVVLPGCGVLISFSPIIAIVAWLRTLMIAGSALRAIPSWTLPAATAFVSTSEGSRRIALHELAVAPRRSREIDDTSMFRNASAIYEEMLAYLPPAERPRVQKLLETTKRKTKGEA